MTPGETQDRYRPRLGHAFKRAAGDYYDRLGLTALASALMIAPLLIAAAAANAAERLVGSLAAGLVLVAAGWFGAWFAWTANLLVAVRIAAYEDPGLDALPDVFRTYGVGVLKLAALDMAITGVMALDAGFFLMGRSVPMQAAGIVTAYLLLLWLTTMLWHGPFLVRENRRTAVILKKSALLLLDNPLFTAGAFFVTIAAGAVLAATGIGAVLAVGSFLACFSVRAHRELLKKYEIVVDEPDVVEDRGWPAPATGKPDARKDGV